jgi:hypothetical protein
MDRLNGLLGTLAAIALCAGCSASSEKASASSARTPAVVSTPDTPPRIAAQPDCVPLWPFPVHLSGTIVGEQKYGAPGYGENPKTDERLQVYLLKLNNPVDVCADTSSVAPQPRAKAVRFLQLTDHVSEEELRRHLGASVEVFGTLRRRVWPRDFTDALIRIDSIPSLRRRLPLRSASASGPVTS